MLQKRDLLTTAITHSPVKVAEMLVWYLLIVPFYVVLRIFLNSFAQQATVFNIMHHLLFF